MSRCLEVELNCPFQKQSESNKWYADINEWWRGDGICSNNGWKPSAGVKFLDEDSASDNHHSFVDHQVGHQNLGVLRDGSQNYGDKKQYEYKRWRYEEPQSSKDRSKILMGA